VPALERGLRVLCEFSREHRTLSAPELARRFDLPRSTVFRLLTTLENMGFLERTEGGRDYRLGMAVLRLGFEYLASLELTQLGTPLLQAPERRAAHAVQPGGARRPLDRLRGQGGAAHAVCQLGQRGHAPAGARHGAGPHPAGRPDAAAAARAVPRRAPRDLLAEHAQDRELELFDMVQADRQRGYVLGEGFFESNISSVAAPVRDHSGHIVAALGATDSREPHRPPKAAWTRWCSACASPPTRSRACSTIRPRAPPRWCRCTPHDADA
jgi:DNA-binding IclR family transcriptional regulator